MKSVKNNPKDIFLRAQIINMSITAALQHNKTYNEDANIKDKEKKANRKKLKEEIVNNLKELVVDYEKREVDEKQHKKNIRQLSKNISKSCKGFLIGGKFKIGTAQKVLNVYLKSLWCQGKIKKPPHFPIDRMILRKIDGCSTIRWTQMKKMDKYLYVIKQAKLQAKSEAKPGAKPLDLADWELENFNELISGNAS